MINDLKKHFQLAFERIRDPLLLVDSAGRILDFNPAARRVLDIDECEVLAGVSATDKSVVFDTDYLTALLARPKSVYGVRLKSVTGDPSDVTVDVVDLGAYRGDVLLKLLHIKDFSAAGSHERWKDELVSTVAHEIKNPLAAMKSSLGLLVSQATGPVTENQQRFLTASIRSIDRLVKLLDGFLDVSRISAGRYLLEPVWVNARNFTTETVRSFETLYNVRRQKLECAVADEVERIFVDAAKLEQVLVNLLSNALKFTPEGGRITVGVEPAGLEALPDELRIMPWREVCDPRFVRVAVKDTGLGMTSDTLANLFVRYHSSSDASSAGGAEETAGTGPTGAHLGLSISRTLTEVQNGTLSVTSEPGVGTEVSLYLPRDEQTLNAVGRMKSLERCVSRVTASKRQGELFVIRKVAAQSWGEVTEDWRKEPRRNPACKHEKDAGLMLWTLGDRTGVLLASGDDAEKGMAALFGPNIVEEGDSARHADGYSIGRVRIPEDGTRLAPLVTGALGRAKPVGAPRQVSTMSTQMSEEFSHGRDQGSSG